MKKILFVLIGLSILLGGCTKDDSITLKTEAVIVWQGDPAADGLGLWVKISGKNYKVSNENDIDSKFKVNDKTVTIEYQNVGKVKYPCYCITGEYEAESVKIISIQ